jgi:hypothetical protein
VFKKAKSALNVRLAFVLSEDVGVAQVVFVEVVGCQDKASLARQGLGDERFTLANGGGECPADVVTDGLWNGVFPGSPSTGEVLVGSNLDLVNSNDLEGLLVSRQSTLGVLRAVKACPTELLKRLAFLLGLFKLTLRTKGRNTRIGR